MVSVTRMTSMAPVVGVASVVCISAVRGVAVFDLVTVVIPVSVDCCDGRSVHRCRCLGGLGLHDGLHSRFVFRYTYRG